MRSRRHGRRRANLKWSAAAGRGSWCRGRCGPTTGPEATSRVPRCPGGRRGYQRHRGGGAARREPQLQRAGELWVVVVVSCRHPAGKQRRRRGRVNHPGSRQGVRASCPPSNHPDGSFLLFVRHHRALRFDSTRADREESLASLEVRVFSSKMHLSY